ncbi:MAG: hypothetical protein MJ086_02030 [Lachnospiraceae bacterium]|nr:hypothetical protein [Lachnospiraceae bacterium]
MILSSLSLLAGAGAVIALRKKEN